MQSKPCNRNIITSTNSKFCTKLIPTQIFISIPVLSVRIFSEFLGILVSYSVSLIPYFLSIILGFIYLNFSLLFLATLSRRNASHGIGNHRIEILRLRRASLRNHPTKNEIVHVIRALLISPIWKEETIREKKGNANLKKERNYKEMR